ncbi:hypothetical protein MMC08_005593 [Hypocenomyce scalaris]|nr:hypothetical protein [Hypocenomyce scalaris]
MSSQPTVIELTSSSESEDEDQQSPSTIDISDLSYDELVAKQQGLKLDYHIHHTNMHAVTKTIFQNRNVPEASRATTKVKVIVEDDGKVYKSRRVALTELPREEECCRGMMREALEEYRLLELRRQEMLKERSGEKT